VRHYHLDLIYGQAGHLWGVASKCAAWYPHLVSAEECQT